MRSWKPHTGKQRVIAFSPDGSTLATSGGTSGFVWLWDPPTGELKAKLQTGVVRTAEFSPDGRHLATPGSNGLVLIWSLESSSPELVRKLAVGGGSEFLAFSPADGRLVSATASNCILWHNPLDARWTMRGPPDRAATRNPYGEPIRSIRFTRDGAQLLVGAADLELWSPDLSGRVGVIPTNKRNGIVAIALSQDGSRAAIVIRNTVRICALAEQKFERTLHWGRDMVHTVAFTPDSRTLLTAGADGSVRFWDVATGQEMRRFDWGIGKVSAAAFAPDGLTCAAGGEKGEIVVWDVDT